MSKRVLITGASTGFGYDTARALAERGHTVFATMRGVAGKNAEKAVALSGWAEENGHTLHIVELDVTDEQSVVAAVYEAMEKGGVDVVIGTRSPAWARLSSSSRVSLPRWVSEACLACSCRCSARVLAALSLSTTTK